VPYASYPSAYNKADRCRPRETVASSLDDARRPDEFTANESLITFDADINVEATLNAASPHDTCDVPSQPRYIYSQPSDQQSLLVNIALLCARARSTLSGVIRAPTLPYFPTCWRVAMESSRQYQIPSTPRVISPSPTPSEVGSAKDGYFGPVTRSSTRKLRVTSPPPIDEDSSGSDPDKRARARSRSPILDGGMGWRRMSALTSRRQTNGSLKKNITLPGITRNGHLSPAQANKNYWREMSRSPSPLGLIPIHQEWRSFVSIRAMYAMSRQLTGTDSQTRNTP
jgi:diacylglycerol kinase (CTP)